MKREIVELDDLVVIEAQHVAQQQGKTLSEVVEAALRTYVEANRRPTGLTWAGMVDVPMNSSTEELDRELADGIDPIEGWSPDRPDTASRTRRVAGD